MQADIILRREIEARINEAEYYHFIISSSVLMSVLRSNA